jgi:hypothetical protein
LHIHRRVRFEQFEQRQLLAALLHTLLPPAGVSGYFGTSVASNSTYRAVGTPYAAVEEGEVDIYDSGTGARLRSIVTPAPTSASLFGTSVALSDSLLAVGAPSYDDTSVPVFTGRAYIYNPATGALLFTLNSPNPSSTGQFGMSVAMSGDLLVVGAPGNKIGTGSFSSGAVYVYRASTGALLRTIPNPMPVTSDDFGEAVAIDGNTIVVGSPFYDRLSSTTGGRAFVFNASTGGLISTLFNPTPAYADEFGSSVAVSGGVVVVGAEADDSQGSNVGSAYVFDAATGALRATLNQPASLAEHVGTSVAVNGNVVLVGAPSGVYGKVYMYDTTGNPIATIQDSQNSGNFGKSLAITGSQFISGAFIGQKAYVYDLAQGPVSATLAAGNLTITDSLPAEGNVSEITVSRSGTNLFIDAVGTFPAAPAGTTLSADKRRLTVPWASITGSLTFNGLGGNDRLTIDCSGDNPIPAGGVTYDGGANSAGGGDYLRVIGSGAQAVDHLPSGFISGDGSLVVDGKVISYVGIEGIDLTAANELETWLPDGDNELTVSGRNGFFPSSAPAMQIAGSHAAVDFVPLAAWNVGTISLFGASATGQNGLTLDLAGLGRPELSFSSLSVGSLAAVNRPTIGFHDFASTEVVHAPLQGLDLELNLATLGLQDGAADEVLLNRALSSLGNPAADIVLNGALLVRVEENALDSLHITASDDDDTLRVVESAQGIVTFTGSPQGVDGIEASFGNAHITDRPEILFEGGAGTNQVQYGFLAGGTVYDQTYAIGNGTDDSAGGEIETRSTTGNQASRLYFTQTEVVSTANAGGRLTVLGTALDDTLDISAFATGTRVTVAATDATSLEIAANSVLALSVFGLGGADLIDLQGVSPDETALAAILLSGRGPANDDGAADTLQVRALPASTTATLEAGAGDDLFLIGGSSAAVADGSTEAILGPIMVAPDASRDSGNDHLTVDDSLSANARDLLVTKTTLEGITGGSITFGNIDELTVFASAGDDTFAYELGTLVPSSDLKQVQLWGGPGGDRFLPSGAAAVGEDAPLTQVQSLLLVGGPGFDTFGGEEPGKQIRLAAGVEVFVYGDEPPTSEAPEGEDPAAEETLYLDLAGAEARTYIMPEGVVMSGGTALVHFVNVDALHLFDGQTPVTSFLQTATPGTFYVPPLLAWGLSVLENQQQASAGTISLPSGANLTLDINDSRFELFNGNQLRLKPLESVALSQGATVALALTLRDDAGNSVSRSAVVTVLPNAFPWHKQALPEDTDNDGDRDINDAIAVIRSIRRGEGGDLIKPRPALDATSYFADVDGNNKLDIQDAIGVIRYLRRHSGGSGEGESSPPVAGSASQAASGSFPAVWDLALMTIADEAARKKRFAG